MHINEPLTTILNSEHLNKQAKNSSNFYFIGIKYSMLFFSLLV